MRGLRSTRGFDYGIYVRALPMLVRFPQIMLAPLLAEFANALLGRLIPQAGPGLLGAANSGLAGLFSLLILAFGLAVAIVVADAGWRYKRAPFDEAWERTRSRAGDIAMSAFGVSFVVYVAGLVGGIVPLAGTVVASLVAIYFLIFALPAAAIGGLPGVASLQTSIERARAAVVPALLATLVFVAVFGFARLGIVLFIEQPLVGLGPFTSQAAFTVLEAIVQAPLQAYVALVLAKTYDDISYARRY